MKIKVLSYGGHDSQQIGRWNFYVIALYEAPMLPPACIMRVGEDGESETPLFSTHKILTGAIREAIETYDDTKVSGWEKPLTEEEFYSRAPGTALVGT